MQKMSEEVQKIYRHVLGNRKATYRRLRSERQGDFLIVTQLNAKGEKTYPLSIFWLGIEDE